MLLHLQPDTRHFLVSFGVWSGLVFLITGVLGLRLRKVHFTGGPRQNHHHHLTLKQHPNPRALATACLTMNILAAVFAGLLFGLSVINLFWLSHRPFFLSPFHMIRHGEIYLYVPLTGLLLAIGVVELVLSAVAASLCCSLRFHCCHSRQTHRRTGGRERVYTDYPSSTMDSGGGASGSLHQGRRARSYSQFPLVSQAAFPGGGGMAVSAAPSNAPTFAGVPPPPSYDEAWDLSSAAAAAVTPSVASAPIIAAFGTNAVTGAGTAVREQSGGRSNARLYQNLQLASSRQSRTSF